MSKSLLDEIAAKMKRKKDLKQEIASRDENVEAFAMSLINDIEDMIAATVNHSLLKTLVPLHIKSFESRVQAIDRGAVVEAQLTQDANGIPRVSGILIKWSVEYQEKRGCDEQLFVDMTSLLLK